MAMRAWLCAADQASLELEPDQFAIIGEASYHLPMLWVALFRPRDLKTAEPIDPDEPPRLAPLVERETALRQLEEARPTLETLFRDLGSVEGYCDWLYRALAAQSQLYISFDSTEVGCDDEAHHAHLRYAMGVFEQRVPLAVGRKSLLHLADCDDSQPFPPLHLPETSPRDLWLAQSKLIGNLEIPPPGNPFSSNAKLL